MKTYSPYLKIDSWKYFNSCITYVIFSWIGFQATSGGWTFLFYQFFGGIFFITILVITFILIVSSQKKQDYIIVDKLFLYLLLIFQIIFYLLNFGDCSDAKGSYLFFERLINGSSYYCHGPGLSIINGQLLMLMLLIVYFVLLAYVLFKPFVSLKKNY